MSLTAVKNYFAQYHMASRIVTFESPTATVQEAAEVHQVAPDQIAKTLSFSVDCKAILIVVSGVSRIDNAKFKQQFACKAKMLKPDEVLRETGHAVGGVCPFGLVKPLAVYLDISLQKHHEVIPAAGDSYSSIRLSLAELEKYSNYCDWVDVCRFAAT